MSDKIYDKANATPEQWVEVAKAQMKGKSPDSLVTETAEGIAVRPLYTAADIAELEYTDTMPGISPATGQPGAVSVIITLTSFSGLISIVLGVMVLSNFPQSATVVLGILLGIELLSNGISAIALAIVGRTAET